MRAWIAAVLVVAGCTPAQVVRWTEQTGHAIGAGDAHAIVCADPATVVDAAEALAVDLAYVIGADPIAPCPQPEPTQHPTLAAIRWCESRDDYSAVSASGRYRGAYQFWRPTWDAVAARAGRPDLIGADPAAASVADQDEMAATLLAWQGTSPWPVCGR